MERKRPRTLERHESDEPRLMAEASRRVVMAEDIQSGTLLHVLARENLQGFRNLRPDNPLALGQDQGLENPIVLTWASACSGSEGMFYASEAINAAYNALKVPVQLQHVFSCECALADLLVVRCVRSFDLFGL